MPVVRPAHGLCRAANSILAKLDLPKADADHRRVLAVLHFLGVV
jgi:hypothetical protein